MSQNHNHTSWLFIDEDGSFTLKDADQTSYLYFPLVNHAGMMSCVTPSLQGDTKIGQHAFLTRPVSVEDLHESREGRNFWVTIDGHAPWSVAGSSALQTIEKGDPDTKDDVQLEAGFLWHTVVRRHRKSGLSAKVTSLVPESGDHVELMRVVLTNEGEAPVRLTATAAVPIYGRSADNLRDHRHVTSLLNRIAVHAHGVVVQPTLVFDERGHARNQRRYAILGSAQDGSAPAAIFPLIQEFRGEGGSLDWPEAVVANLDPRYSAGDEIEGYEALGGMRFDIREIRPGESFGYVLIFSISEAETSEETLLARYGSLDQFEDWLKRTQEAWKAMLDHVRVRTGDPRFDGWMRWVSAQPVFRQLFGNSFLPYHDYGRGGRGWRDLWQDTLGLILMQRGDMGETLRSHFAGIRFDGSNATIIGHQPGEFKADRNDIPRVWMDHGAWPLLTTRMYMDWTGDLDILLDTMPYFKDHHTHRCHAVDPEWRPESGTTLKTSSGEVYRGSILEHLLVQNLVPFFNVGEHNCILLEGADWNDAYDMAPNRGESAAFTGFYAGNLQQIADILKTMERRGVREVSLAKELAVLLDTLYDPIDYTDIRAKQLHLQAYFDSCAACLSGEQVDLPLQSIAADLRKKAGWLKKLLREQEWIRTDQNGWFNGYYDDQGRRLEGVFDDCVQMTLAGQVFQLMFGIATQQQAAEIVRSVDRYLYDPALHGVRLNNRFCRYTDALGRVFGFAFGHKENGAMFSHMSVMYAYALFKAGFASEGSKILREIFAHCQDFSVSKMLPGLPEYLTPEGRGAYPFLTGSASWYLLTMITEVFGLRGDGGDLLINPKLTSDWFDGEGQASICIPFAGKIFEVLVHNPERLSVDQYRVARVFYQGRSIQTVGSDNGLRIPRVVLEEFPEEDVHQLHVDLDNLDQPNHF